jgi:hypothetical protein
MAPPPYKLLYQKGRSQSSFLNRLQSCESLRHASVASLVRGYGNIVILQGSCTYSSQVKYKNATASFGIFDTLSKAQEVHDIFAYCLAVQAKTCKPESVRASRPFSHYFTDSKTLRLHFERLESSWKERYAAYDRVRVKSCRNKWADPVFKTRNEQRKDFHPVTSPFPLYFTEWGAPLESMQLCGGIKQQLFQLEQYNRPRVFAELYLRAYTCSNCGYTFAAPEDSEACGTKTYVQSCRKPCGAIRVENW